MRPPFFFADSLSNQELCNKLSDADLRAAAGCSSTTSDPTTLVTTVVNLLLFAIGLFSVIMIIFGAVQIATSAGNSSAVEKGKKTILYAVIGLVVSILSYAILNFVLTLLQS